MARASRETGANTIGPTRRYGRPTAGLAALTRGSHLCALYRDDEEHRRIAVSFLQCALAAGDRIIYVATSGTSEAPLELLEHDGVDTERQLRSGQLILREFEEIYGRADAGELPPIEEGLRRAAERSQADGFPGLRLATELGGLPRVVPLEQLMRWERVAGRAQLQVGITSVCQYDQRDLADDEAELIAGAHLAIADPDTDVPLATFCATHEPWGLRVTGEIDLSNRGDFARSLRARIAHHHEIALDLADLEFIDVGALQIVYKIGAELPGNGRILLVNVSDWIREVIEVAGLADPHVELAP